MEGFDIIAYSEHFQELPQRAVMPVYSLETETIRSADSVWQQTVFLGFTMGRAGKGRIRIAGQSA